MIATPQKWRSPGMISSLSVEWATPRQLFEVLHAEFGFRLDPCPMDGRPIHTDVKPGSYGANWAPGPVWLNPPYGKEIGDWLERAAHESTLGVTVVALIPARTDTAWWHDYVMEREIRFLRGRLKFTRPDGSTGRAPFPSAVVIFNARRTAA